MFAIDNKPNPNTNIVWFKREWATKLNRFHVVSLLKTCIDTRNPTIVAWTPQTCLTVRVSHLLPQPILLRLEHEAQVILRRRTADNAKNSPVKPTTVVAHEDNESDELFSHYIRPNDELFLLFTKLENKKQKTKTTTTIKHMTHGFRTRDQNNYNPYG